MLIALLAVLGVDLIVVVALLVSVLSRKRWVKGRPGAFRGAIRVAGGEIDGVGSEWVRGYGRWVSDVLVWTKAPLLFRNAILPMGGLGGERAAIAHEVRRLGENPIVLRFEMEGAAGEIAVRAEDRRLAAGPYGDVATVPARPDSPR
jgi:hypothetical protein